MIVKLTESVRYFRASGLGLLGRTNRHIDGSKLFNDQFCGLVFSGTIVDLGNIVQKGYDHRDVEAVKFIYSGTVFYFLKKEIDGKYSEVKLVI